MTASKKPRKAPSRANGPSEIAPGVFVGGWNDALKFEGARFCVLDDAPEDRPPSAHVQIYEESNDRAIPANLDRLAADVRAAHGRGQPVLMFCGHGIRRSPLAGAWYLHRAEGLPLAKAYERIRAVRPKIEEAREWIGHPDNLDTA
jgi:dual specificity protein phosphatase-like protein